jgi:uncharacterized protein (TIGR01777 family)
MAMSTFEARTVMPAPAEEVYAWHARPGAFERLNLPFDPVEVEERSGGLEVGARTVLRVKVGPVTRRWVAEHTACEPGRLFRDEQRSGPFARWVHTHRFEPLDRGVSELIDQVEFELPVGRLGALFGGPFTRATLDRMFGYRHAVTRADLARHAAFAARPRLTFAITGASGSIGSALGPFLSTGGHTVRPVRRSGNEVDAEALVGADVVVNLAGAGVADERWTPARKALLAESRVDFTRRLIAAAERVGARPRVWIQGSAVGIYGDRGDEVLTEASPVGPGDGSPAAFLSTLCVDWEAAGQGAERLGARVVHLRTGIVQTARGGALAKVLPAFKAGAGGPLGSGRNWQSWISIEDMLGLILHLSYADGLAGPVNAVAPHPVTSAEYARVLGRVIGRPALIPTPALALKALFGDVAPGVLLASQRAQPAVAVASGFRFLHPTLEDALRFTLGR